MLRWFILSDSPPEKDIQWSNPGVASANKFLEDLEQILLLKFQNGNVNLNNEEVYL